MHLRPVVRLEPASPEFGCGLRGFESPIAEDADEKIGLGVREVRWDPQIGVRNVGMAHSVPCRTGRGTVQ